MPVVYFIVFLFFSLTVKIAIYTAKWVKINSKITLNNRNITEKRIKIKYLYT